MRWPQVIPRSLLTPAPIPRPDNNASGRMRPALERLQKNCSRAGARILEFWRGFGEGAGLKNPEASG